MKKQLLLGFTIVSIGLSSCSGNRADGKDGQKDTSYKYSDTSKHSAKDTVGKDAYQDSISNTPRLPETKQ